MFELVLTENGHNLAVTKRGPNKVTEGNVHSLRTWTNTEK